MILAEGHRQMEEVGFARFSAREVAKRIGYSIGTLYNVFGTYDGLIVAINARTLSLWARFLEARLAEAGDDRIDTLVRAYFAFARAHPKSWAAIYDHRIAAGEPMPDFFAAALSRLTGIVVDEVARALPLRSRDAAPALARSLLASVHGHCVFAANGTFALLGEADPVGAAIARVREGLAAASVPP